MDNLLSGDHKEEISCAERCGYVALDEVSANEISMMEDDAT
jgi:hypothetical protein